jgi:hypothetical protein
LTNLLSGKTNWRGTAYSGVAATRLRAGGEPRHESGLADRRVVRIWECELQKAKKRSTPHLTSGHSLPDRGGEDEPNKVMQQILEKLSRLHSASPRQGVEG